MIPLRYKGPWLAIGIILIIVVTFLSLKPDAPGFGDDFDFKWGHVLAYATLSGWFSQIMPRSRRRVAMALGFAVMGIVLEYLQVYTGRGFEYKDMVYNSAGALSGLALGYLGLDRVLLWFEYQLVRHGLVA